MSRPGTADSGQLVRPYSCGPPGRVQHCVCPRERIHSSVAASSAVWVVRTAFASNVAYARSRLGGCLPSGRGRAGVVEERIDAGMSRTPSAAWVSVEVPRQRQLPLPWNLSRPGRVDRFAHPVEAEFGRILAFYGVRWVYEPTNFVLRWTADGRPAESFTPDFYLPAHRLYIELTTMRQPLVTRKNRKLRRLREVFPGIRVKLLYRRDLERLLRSYDEHVDRPAAGKIGSIVATERQLAVRVTELVDGIISAEIGSCGAQAGVEPPFTLLTIEPAARTFAARLRVELEQRGVAVDVADGVIAHYGRNCHRKTAGFAQAPRIKLAGRPVLLVTDMVSTGLSAGFVLDWVRRQGARSFGVCTLFDRPRARLIDLQPRFAAFDAPDDPIAGFGLGQDSELAALPYVATITTE
jgi:hypoxanthine-guanine phosphoribosyltransferase